MQLIRESWLPEDQKAHALQVLKTKPWDFIRSVVFNIAYYSIFYVGCLSLLPVLGLTADAKRQAQDDERELDEIESRFLR